MAERQNLGERKSIKVSVFSDEFEALGLNDDMTLFEACTAVRTRMGVPVPARERERIAVGGLRKAISQASPEQRAKIVELLRA